MASKNTLAIAASALALTLGAFVPAHAALTEFASFIPLSTSTNMAFTNSGGVANNGKSGTLAATPNNGSDVVLFSFQNSLETYVNNLSADLTFSATSTNTAATKSVLNVDKQSNVTGTFSFKTVAPITINATTYAAGSNLLSGTFSTALISGRNGGTTANLTDDSTIRAVISFTSAFLDFSNVGAEDINISLNSVTPSLGFNTGDALRSFLTSASGKFSSDPQPRVLAVPEPASWALMTLGVGGIGFAARRRAAANTAT